MASQKLKMSALELMEGWMATVHAHHLKRNEKNVPFGYPRILPVGTRGDLLTKGKKEEVLKELGQSFDDKAFHEILKEPVIIDNTTAGSDNEDPGYQRIRKDIFNFTTALKQETPIAWVLFRRLMEVMVTEKKKNAISLSEAIHIAAACKIEEENVLSVLNFYHELGVLLYYHHIKSLNNTVILNPKWFVECLGKVLALEGQEEAKHEMRREWKLLRSKGILVQPLYAEVWRRYEEITQPEAIMELLVSFQLAAEIHTDEFYDPNVKQFFLPAVLQYSTQSYQPPSTNTIAPLHITFKEGYVVPGYFVRLVAVLQRSPLCCLYFDEIFHDQVSFHFGESKASLITLVQASTAIEVHIRFLRQYVPLANMKKDCSSLQVLYFVTRNNLFIVYSIHHWLLVVTN